MASPSGYEPLLLQAPTMPVPSPVVVVSPQFCAKELVPLTVTKKVMSLTGGDFTITNPSGAVVLQFKGSVWSVRNSRVLLDAAGHSILSMHEKVLSMHNRWEAFRGDSSKSSDLLFTVKRSTLLQLKTELDVFLAGKNTTEQVCDFKLKGSYFDRDCAFYLGDSNTMIAQISRKYSASNVLLGKDIRSTSPCSLTLTMRLLLWFWMRCTAGIGTTDEPHLSQASIQFDAGHMICVSNYASDISHQLRNFVDLC